MTGITVTGLGRTFPPQRFPRRVPAVLALSNVDFTVPAGTLCGVLGGNGAGKTTLLEILATLITPSTGMAFVGGYDVQRDGAAVRRLVSYCPSGGTAFFSRLTGRNNLEFFGALHDVPAASIAARIDASSRLFQVHEALDRRVEAYSDGMRQRLALARAHLSGSKVWLLDEPTRGLDPLAREQAGRTLRRQVSECGVTAILVTHDLPLTAEICDQVIVFHQGRITLDAPAAELQRAPGGLAAAYAGATDGGATA